MEHRKSVKIAGNALIIAIWIACLLAAAAMLSGCKTTGGRPISGEERAFHLEHGAGAFTPRRGYGSHHYRWRQ